MILRFDETGTFAVKPVRARKYTGLRRTEEIATAVIEQPTTGGVRKFLATAELAQQ